MKKICVCLLAACALLASLPAQAMEFYQTGNGEIIVEGTCQDVSHIARLFDDDPEKNTSEESGGSDPVGPTPSQIPLTFSEQEFSIAQEHLIAYVRDVNWKTGFNLTLRDLSWIGRLKVVCTGAWNSASSFRLKLQKYDQDIDTHFQQLEDDAFEALANAVTDAAFSQAAKLSLSGMYNAMLTTHPFLLLLINEATYKELLDNPEVEAIARKIILNEELKADESQVTDAPLIQQLADNMYRFFVYRAVFMGEEYNQNTKPLLQVAKLGKGDAFNTWAMFAQFGERMYKFEQADQLTPDAEKSIHIWKLRSIMAGIKRTVKVKKRAAEIAIEDPENKKALDKLNETDPKNPTLDQQAKKYLSKLSKEEVLYLLRTYLDK